MEPVTWGFIGTIIGTVAGASASILTTVIAQNNLRRIKKDEADFSREVKRREFQFNNLLKIQDVLSSSMRLVARAHLEDMENFRNGTIDNETSLLSEELNNEILLSNKELSVLSERIEDEALRTNIKMLRAKMTKVLVAQNAQESEESLRTLSFAFDESMADIGTVLRSSL